MEETRERKVSKNKRKEPRATAVDDADLANSIPEAPVEAAEFALLEECSSGEVNSVNTGIRDCGDGDTEFVLETTTNSCISRENVEDSNVDNCQSLLSNSQVEPAGQGQDQNLQLENHFQQVTADDIHAESECEEALEVIATAPEISYEITESPNFSELPAYNQTNYTILTAFEIQSGQSQTQIRSRPATSTQIKLLYNNFLLENNDEFVRQFLTSTIQCSFDGFELYELLTNNLRAYNKLTGCEKSLNSLKDSCDDLEKNIWTLSTETLSEKSYCEDNSAVTATYKIHTAEFNEQSAAQLKRTLKEIKELLQNAFSLQTYSVQLSKTQIDHFFHKSFGHLEFQNLQSQAELPSGGFRPLLRKCISTLFLFIRKPLLHSLFINDCRTWVEKCAGLLLRIATIEDHFFLLNHVLRCPPKVISKWGATIIQVPPIDIPFDSSTYLLNSFGHLNLDYAVAMLSTILRAVPKREEFLLQHQFSSKLNISPVDSSQQWVLVDSDGEDEPDDTTTFKESDLIALLQQIPFETVFKRVLLTCRDNTGEEIHDIRLCSEHSILKLIGFSVHLVGILGTGFVTYYTDRYRQLVKLIGRLILHTAQHVTDQLETFSEANLSDNNFLENLSVEYDAFMFGTIEVLNSARNIDSIQFMAAIPYQMISENMLWEIYRLLTKWDVLEENILRNENITADFEHELLAISESNAVYMLTTLSAMALSQRNEASDFVRIVTLHLFQIGFLSPITKDICSKHVRDLLSNLTRKYPCMISTLIHKMKSSISILDKMSLFLLKELAFDLWKPTESDFLLLSYWLLNFQAYSLENQIGRFIIQSMNWDFSKQDELSLPYELHCRTAVLVVTTHFKWDRQGGITESVKQQMPSWVSRNSDLTNWAWEIIRRLHLHAFDRHCMTSRSGSFTEVINSLPSFENERELEPLQRAVEEKNPIGCAVALLLTPVGHLLPLVCGQGFEFLEILVQASRFEAVINVLFFLTPLFAESHDSLIGNEKFQLIIKSIVNADASYVRMAKNLISNDFPGPVAKLFGSMVQAQLEQFSRFELTEISIVEMWIVVLTKLENWNKNDCILYWLDILARFAYSRTEVHIFVHNYFSTLYKQIPAASSTTLSSMFFGWSPQSTTFLANASYPLFGYITYFVLSIETELENSTGFWKSLISSLSNPKTSVDAATKKATNVTKFNTSINYLSIYRWAYQALDASFDHPLLLIFWQKFFLRYFHRTSTHDNYRDGVGERFFEGMINSTFLKKLKKRLHDLLEAYKERIEKLESTCSDSHLKANMEENSFLVLENLRNCYTLASAMVLWIEDSKFHKDSLYISALPPQCQPSRLLSLTEGDMRDWMEYVDIETMLAEETASCKEFLTYITRLSWKGMQKFTRFSAWRNYSVNRHEEFVKRLNSYDKPVDPPPLVEFIQILPELNSVMLLDKLTMLHDLKPHFEFLSEYARLFTLQISQHGALDCSYCEHLPQLYSSKESEALVNVTCQGRKKSSGCAGAAHVLFQFTEARLNERIGHLIQQNRSEYHDLIQSKGIQPPPLHICAAAVFIEDFITNLVVTHRKLYQDNKDGQALLSVGIELFYFIVGQVTDDANFYPPTRQLYSSFLEILGIEFVGSRPVESKRLVSTCICRPGVTGLLAPHINLAKCDSKTLIDIYKQITEIPRNDSDLAFVLLSKLDLSSWLLKTRPSLTLTERSQLISLIWKALTLEDLPDQRNPMVHGTYRNHLKIMLLFDFPQHFGEILNYLLDGSEKQVIDIDVWYDFFNALSRDSIRFRRDMEPFNKKKELKRFAIETDTLQRGEIMETAKLLADHFTNARLSYGIYGLYPKYNVYLEPISCFLQMVCHLITASALKNSKGLLSPKIVDIVWPAIRDVYSPWILPYDENTIQQRCAQWIQQMNFESSGVLQPFVRNDSPFAMAFMSDFTDCVLFLAETLPGSPALFSNLWNFYVENYAKVTVKDHVLNVVHTCFISIPWTIFWPTFSDLELMNKVVIQYLPTCHSFLGVVFAQINWRDWICHFVNSNVNNQPALSKCHSHLLNITVNLANDIVARESPTWVNVMEAVQNLNWQYVTPNYLEPILNWFVMSIDSRVVLALETTHYMDKASFRLLKIASGYSSTSYSETDTQPRGGITFMNKSDLNRKRYLFVRSYIRLVISVSSKHKAMIETHAKFFERSLQNLLTDLAIVIKQENQQLEDFTVHLKEIINLMSNHYLATITRNSIIEWCEANRNSPLCIFNGIIQLSLGGVKVSSFITAPLLEVSIRLAFKHKETTWKSICELSHITNEQGDWTSYVEVASKDGHYLVLNCLLLKKLNQLCMGGLTTIGTLTNLLKNIKPREENETKLPLVYKCFINIIVHLLSEMNKLPGKTLEKAVNKFMTGFIHHLGSLADEKQGWGILGAFGLGRSPQISYRGKFFARCLHVFLQAQMPTNSPIRVLPDSPGHFINNTSSSTSLVVRPNSDILYALEKLEALKLDRQYEELVDSIDTVVTLIKNPAYALSTYDIFVNDVVSHVFTETFLTQYENSC